MMMCQFDHKTKLIKEWVVGSDGTFVIKYDQYEGKCEGKASSWSVDTWEVEDEQ